MSEEMFLLAAVGMPDSTTKTIELTENVSERIIFRPPENFHPGAKDYPGDAVVARMKELCYDESEAGRIKPGFVVVPQSLVGRLVALDGIVVLGKVSIINRTYRPSRFDYLDDSELEEEEGVEIPPVVKEALSDTKFDCEFCGRKGFSRESYINHLRGFHIKNLVKKQGSFSQEDERVYQRLKERLKELGEDE